MQHQWVRYLAANPNLAEEFLRSLKEDRQEALDRLYKLHLDSDEHNNRAIDRHMAMIALLDKLRMRVESETKEQLAQSTKRQSGSK